MGCNCGGSTARQGNSSVEPRRFQPPARDPRRIVPRRSGGPGQAGYTQFNAEPTVEQPKPPAA